MRWKEEKKKMKKIELIFILFYLVIAVLSLLLSLHLATTRKNKTFTFFFSSNKLREKKNLIHITSAYIQMIKKNEIRMPQIREQKNFRFEQKVNQSCRPSDSEICFTLSISFFYSVINNNTAHSIRNNKIKPSNE